MNSNSPDAATDLLGRAQPYNDSVLQKRVTCLGSGLLLCFIIAGAGLGISIIVLLKFEGIAGVFPQYAANQTEYMKALKDQIKLIQQQVEALNKEVSNHVDADLRMLDLDSSDSFGMDHEEHMAPVGKDENVPDHNHHTGQDENEPDKGSFPSEEEKEVTTKSSDPHAHHHHSNHDHHGSMTQPEVDSPSINDLHDRHGPMTEPEVESPSINELLCDDSDQCLPFVDTSSGLDGSGELLNKGGFMDDTELSDSTGVDAIEGSGDCIQYSRPMCPRNFKICYTDDICPIPVCCLHE